MNETGGVIAGVSCENGRELMLLLERQQVLYRRMRGFAERQRALVTQGDARPLLELLASRQEAVNELLGMNKQLAAYRADWPLHYARMNPEERSRATELLEEANASLTEILASDQRDTAVLGARRSQVGGELAAAFTAGRASSAYGEPSAARTAISTDARA